MTRRASLNEMHERKAITAPGSRQERGGGIRCTNFAASPDFAQHILDELSGHFPCPRPERGKVVPPRIAYPSTETSRSWCGAGQSHAPAASSALRVRPRWSSSRLLREFARQELREFGNRRCHQEIPVGILAVIPIFGQHRRTPHMPKFIVTFIAEAAVHADMAIGSASGIT